MTSPHSTDDIRATLNLETSRIGWHELQTYYARGQVVQVAPELDLLEVAAELAADNKGKFEQWMIRQQVGEVSADLARAWYDREAQLWAVVVAPWVLVQDRHAEQLH